jgi:hypothetical protein
MPADSGPLSARQESALRRGLGRLPNPRDNDGMVPTRAQAWGEIIHASEGDHLDVLGHFYLPNHVPPHFDWLNSGAAFTLSAFERMWQDVETFVVAR